jgi:hypothetical protein
MTKHIDRLMSRASVAAMAAFAKEPVSTVPAFAERVDENPPAGDGAREVDPIDGLSAEEQAGLDAMKSGAPPTPDGDSGDDEGADGDSDSGDDEPAGDGGEAPAPVADGAPAPPRQPKTINYGRHQKEIAKLAKERDAAIAALDGSRQETAKEREERTRLDERSRLLLEAINTKAPPAAAAPAADADPEPDKSDDPLGHLEWRNRRLEKQVADLAGGQQRQQQATAAENEETQTYNALVADIQRTVNGDPARGVAPDPTMTDAFVHLRETRYQELGFIYAGIDINDPAECAKLSPEDQAKLSDNIQRTFHNEQMLVAREALGKRTSPAAVIRNLARARGWKPAAAAPAGGDPPAPAAPDRGAAPPAPRAAAAPAPQGSVKDQLNAVRDNLDASRSLSDAGGSPGGQMTPERLAQMSEGEFEEYYNSIPKNKLDALMGKPANM